MHTSDLAVMDDDGYVNIVGRIKDMIIRGGENVYPREVEEFLYTRPDIVEVPVIGVPDAPLRRGGHGPSPATRRRRHHRRGRQGLLPGHDPHYKVPRCVRFTDAQPPTGAITASAK